MITQNEDKIGNIRTQNEKLFNFNELSQVICILLKALFEFFIQFCSTLYNIRNHDLKALVMFSIIIGPLLSFTIGDDL